MTPDKESDGRSAAVKKNGTAMTPWGPHDLVRPSIGMVRDSLHTRFRLPCPGTPTNAVQLPETILFNPTNTGTCPCAIFIASIGADGNYLGGIRLDPGDSQQLYEAETGAAFIAAACSSGCTVQDCFSELTIDNPVA
jgi:hypothetical protein